MLTVQQSGFQLLTIHVFGDRGWSIVSGLPNRQNTSAAWLKFGHQRNHWIGNQFNHHVFGGQIMLSHIHTQQTCTPTETGVVCHVMHHLDIQTKQITFANRFDVGCLGFSVCILDKQISKSRCSHSWFLSYWGSVNDTKLNNIPTSSRSSLLPLFFTRAPKVNKDPPHLENSQQKKGSLQKLLYRIRLP